MWIRYILLGISGLAAGALVAAGVFALITSIGVIARMADKSRTGSHVKKYETAVILGGIFGNVINIFEIPMNMGGIWLLSQIMLAAFGGFAGIFVGCLATSLAESLNTTAIFSRRVRLHRGMGAIILCVALGKLIASLMFFYMGWY